MPKTMKTIDQLYRWGTQELKNAGKEDAAIDAEILLLHVLECSKIDRILKARDQVQEEKQQKYENFIAKRATGIPTQHLTKEQEFMGLSFEVNGHVLIPRQDTETLVEKVLEIAKKRPIRRILEVGVGSGCISISLAHYLQQVSIVGIDISEKALEVARRNAFNNGVSESIEWVLSDVFSDFVCKEESFDILISNPPYIATDVCQGLMEEVRLHDPMNALDGGSDGLDFYRKITKQGKKYITHGGMLVYEIGYDQGEIVPQIMRENGFENVAVYKDLVGHDRVVLGEKI